ncbi:MAG: hypothetical protein ABI347_12025 [Nitrososphaera sp.]
MVKVTKSVTIEIEKDGKSITITPDELEEIKRQLDAAIRERGREFRAKLQSKRETAKTGGETFAPKAVHMSDAKRKEIMAHVNKKLSATPRTLSSLLDGVSYVPNYLPMIRKMVEGQNNVAKKQVGKRTLYFRK